jgi:hypoxanthine phosphoribosyltransferase
MTVAEAIRVLSEADLLADEAEIQAAIADMAAGITSRLQESRPVLLCIMHGGLVFAGQLLPRLFFPLEVGYIHASRYGHETSGSGLNWSALPAIALNGRNVLLVDDILDEGVTLAAISDYCRAQGALSVLTAVLVNKCHERKVTPGFKADFTGLNIEDRFIFGYGLDFKGYWRNAPGIYAVKEARGK